MITTREGIKKYYTRILPALRQEAWYCGWGLGLHGSMRRDLDLIAVPWRKDARTPNFLAHRLMKIAGGHTYPISYIKKDWQKKPHGRIAISLPLLKCPRVRIMGPGIAKENETHGLYLDLSVMPMQR